ncbi:MAG: hypothetical protein Ct9H300mP17_01090 [Candidatus Nitrosopelagicus sp.]|nr:MAG: hypothetical protein Ct9H300mP17_01090 [Candidatus Nitrosopelagicus sp.]
MDCSYGKYLCWNSTLKQSVGFDGEYIEFMAPGVLILTAILLDFWWVNTFGTDVMVS